MGYKLCASLLHQRLLVTINKNMHIHNSKIDSTEWLLWLSSGPISRHICLTYHIPTQCDCTVPLQRQSCKFVQVTITNDDIIMKIPHYNRHLSQCWHPAKPTASHKRLYQQYLILNLNLRANN